MEAAGGARGSVLNEANGVQRSSNYVSSKVNGVQRSSNYVSSKVNGVTRGTVNLLAHFHFGPTSRRSMTPAPP